VRSNPLSTIGHGRARMILITTVILVTLFPDYGRDSKNATPATPAGRFSLPASIREESALALFGVAALWVAAILRRRT
jgi:hypothetical protein